MKTFLPHPALRVCAVVVFAALATVRTAAAEERKIVLEPAATRISFTLGATLHTVAGTVGLVHGELSFDPSGGAASGQIVVDAKSAQTGNSRRDAIMHREVLESGQFPEIVWHAERLEVLSREETTAQVRLLGTLQLHGQRRPLEIPAQLTARGDRIVIAATFRVPFVDWGMHDPSNFVLRVDRFVDVSVAAEGVVGAP